MTEDNIQSDSPARTLEYNTVCQLIGHLYLDAHHSKISTENHYSSIVEDLTNQVSQLIEENENLKLRKENACNQTNKSLEKEDGKS